jgi:E3 ubiquitin-protein ligase UBR4
MARATFAALPGLAPLGARAREAFELARWFAESADADKGSAFGDDFLTVLCDTSGIVDKLAEALARRVETLETHPDAAAYAALRAQDESWFQNSSDVDVSAFILETDPSPAACGGGSFTLLSSQSSRKSHEISETSASLGAFATHRLETLKSDLWHTHCAVAAKLRAPTSLSSLTLSTRSAVHDRGSRAARVRRFSVFVSLDARADVARLKAELPLALDVTDPSSEQKSLWTRVAVGEMDPDAREAEILFPTPVAGVCAVALRLDAFHVHADARARETPRCPRCTRPVLDRHGVCAHCHENVHQCRRCRNINYERPDAFLCNECGHSRFARVEISLTAVVSETERGEFREGFVWSSSAMHRFASRPRLLGEEDAARALAALEEESAAASRAREALRERKDELARELLTEIPSGGVPDDAVASPTRRPGFSLARSVPGASASVVGSAAADARAACASAHADLVASETRREALRVSLAEYASRSAGDAGDGEGSEGSPGTSTTPFPESAAAVLASEYRSDYRCAHAFVSLALPACVALVEADARARANLPSLVTDSISAVSVADRFVRSGAPAALLATSPARTLDAAARRDATRFVAATAAASSPDTALALSDAPFERARALLETARARQKNAAM